MDHKNIGTISCRLQSIFNRVIDHELYLLHTEEPILVVDFPRLAAELIKQRYMDILLVDISYFAEGEDIASAIKYLRDNMNATRIVVVAPNMQDRVFLQKMVSYGVLDIVTTNTQKLRGMSSFQLEEAIRFDIEQAIINPKTFGQMSYLLHNDASAKGNGQISNHTSAFFYSPKGGVGTTTIATEVAMAMAYNAKRYSRSQHLTENVQVCLLDLHRHNGMLAYRIPQVLAQKDAIHSWNDILVQKINQEKEEAEKANGVYQLKNVAITRSDLELCMIQDESSGLYILPNGNLFREQERLLTHEERMYFIQQLRKIFDVVIIDTPTDYSRSELVQLGEVTDWHYVIGDTTTPTSVLVRSIIDAFPSVVPIIVHAQEKDTLDERTLLRTLDMPIKHHLPYTHQLRGIQECGSYAVTKLAKSTYSQEIQHIASSIMDFTQGTEQLSGYKALFGKK